MKSYTIFSTNHKPHVGDVFIGLLGKAFVCVRTRSYKNTNFYTAYCQNIEVSDLSKKQKERWASLVYWNDVVGSKAFIPGTNEYSKREIANLKVKEIITNLK